MSKFLIIPNRNNLEESIAFARKKNLGFEYNDFFHPAILDDKAKCEEVINTYLSNDLPDITTNHGDFFDVLVFSEDAKIREISKQRIYESMEVSKKLGVKGTIFHTNHTSFITTAAYMDNFVSRNVEFFKEVCNAYPDIDVYIENMFDTNPHLLARLANEMKDVKNFGVCLDYAHATAFGTGDIDEWINELAPFVKHLHINDNDLVDDLHLPVGSGKIDWNRFKEYYEKHFTDCTVLIEVTALEGQKKSVEFLEKLGIL